MTVSFSKSFLCSTALVIALPGAAFANVTAAEVWENWKVYAQSMGQTITVGSQSTSGGTMTLNDVSFSMEFPEGTAGGTLALLEFQERGDGTVAISMSPEYQFSVARESEEETFDFGILMRQTGTSIVASGDAGTIKYDFLAAEISLGINKLIADGKEIEADVSFVLTDVDGQYESTEGEVNKYVSQMTAAKAQINVDFTDPDDGAHILIDAAINNLSSNSVSEIPADFDIENTAEMFSGGFNVSGGMKTSGVTSSISLDDEGDSFDLKTSSSSSSLDFVVGDGSIEYGGSAADIEYKLKSAQIPLPEVTLAIAESDFKLLMPLAENDEPSDFSMLFKLVGLEVSEMLWGMIDPAQTLPRDPATLILDVSGKGKWLVNILDEEETRDIGDNAPGELHELTINDLTLALLGAEITGGGDFTFDNSDLETFDGMPAPTGTIDLKLVGINGLLDKLSEMGLLPQDQAMGARMMLGLFARPGDGDDTLTSTLEVKGDGSIFANGQQLK